VHNYGTLTHGQNFLGHFKTKNRFSATSVDQLPHQLVAMWMYGTSFSCHRRHRPHELLSARRQPMASNGSLMTVPDFRARLKALHTRGGRMIVLDPRRTETAEVADEHLFIRPAPTRRFCSGC